MKLSFYGAAHEVTGSCFLLEAAGKRILIDCGMEQGADEFVNQPVKVPPSDLDCILLTHAHMDHSGNLPLFYKNGFKGNIFSTGATYSLCEIMLRDSAHIQTFEAEWRNRKAKRAGAPPIEPLYDMNDAVNTLKLFKPYDYNTHIELFDGIEIRFLDAGHLFGSSSIEVWATESGVTKKIVFSGDIGNINQPLINDPTLIDEADYVVMESTYGNRLHGEKPDYIKSLTEVLEKTFSKGGNVVVPSFAVGRTQEMLYFLRKIKEDGLVKSCPDFSVYVDSPLAIEATNIFLEEYSGYYDEEAMELIRKGINPISFPGVHTSLTSDDSKAINMDKACKVILSASGMCEAGRIRHHLKHNLWRKECTVLFVGYQAVGTLGRMLIDGVKKVKLFGEEIAVEAEIAQLPGISGHADKNMLIGWITALKKKPQHVFVVHGQSEVCDEFTEELKALGYNASAPYSGDEYDILENAVSRAVSPVPIEKKKSGAALPADGKETAKNPLFAKLVAAGKRLSAVIYKKEKSGDEDIRRFTDEINDICDFWDK